MKRWPSGKRKRQPNDKQVCWFALQFYVRLCLMSGNTCLCLTEAVEDTAKKLEKRNDESSVNEARARYLQRKQNRLQRKDM